MRYRKYLMIIIAAVLVAGCSTTKKLPMPTSKAVPINSLNTAERLANEAGQIIIGPRSKDKEVRRAALYAEPKLNREPDPARLARLGAELVNRTITVPFEYGKSAFYPTAQQSYHIKQLLVIADRIEIRGRTDSAHNNEINIEMAKARADAARRYLLDLNAPNSIISINAVGAGDHVADNRTPQGRGKNRRVEIEFFFDDLSLGNLIK